MGEREQLMRGIMDSWLPIEASTDAETRAILVACYRQMESDAERNRELTRQVEQLQARADAALELVVKWRVDAYHDEKNGSMSKAERHTAMRVAESFRVALAAPLSSAPTEPGRADTGGDET